MFDEDMDEWFDERDGDTGGWIDNDYDPDDDDIFDYNEWF